jgi:hypothetical protein
MITFERFSEIWNREVTPTMIRMKNSKSKKVIHQDGCSQHTIDALVAASNGDFSHFDKIDRLLRKHDRVR